MSHLIVIIMSYFSDYFGMGVTDPWEIHGTREKRGVRPNEETYANRINKVKISTCPTWPWKTFE